MSTKQPPKEAVIRQRQNHSQRVNSSQPKESPTRRPTTRPLPKEEPHAGHPADEVKLGIDLWHAVEFSKNGRTPTNRLSAAHRGNPSSLGHGVRQVKSRDPTDSISMSGTYRSTGSSEAALPAVPTEHTPRPGPLSCRHEVPGPGWTRCGRLLPPSEDGRVRRMGAN